MTLSMPLILVLLMVVLYAGGVYLLLDRSLTRILLGFLLVGNATNLLIFLTSGSFGAAPLGGTPAEEMSDPLPQAFILTSIVITFGVSAFLLALIYRSWNLARDREDAVSDDDHDLELAQSAALTTASLTTDEVTDEDLAETPEFAADGSVAEFDDDDDELPRGASRAAGSQAGRANADEASVDEASTDGSGSREVRR